MKTGERATDLPGTHVEDVSAFMVESMTIVLHKEEVPWKGPRKKR